VAAAKAKSRSKATAGRIAVVLLIVGALAFAVEGGEYGTSDLVRQRSRQRALAAAVDSLEHQIDSMTKLKKRLATDAALQERVAREEFGMVKGDKELLYRFTAPRDSARP
jgi:cell division protein FtsB